MKLDRMNLKVRYAETDQMGIVHHANYYIWYEAGRSSFIAKLGLSYRDIEEQGLLFPLVESQCKYLEGAKYEDDLIILTKIEELTPAKVVFTYEVHRMPEEKLLATGKTIHPFVDKNFKIINLKKKYPELYDKLNSCLA